MPELDIKIYRESFPIGVGALPTFCEASDCKMYASRRVRYRVGRFSGNYYLCKEHHDIAMKIETKCMFGKEI